MITKLALAIILTIGCVLSSEADETPVELTALRASIGTWDAEAEVWSQGPDKPSMKFKGVETNSPYGEYWIASDSEYVGMKLHAIIGYDLDQKKMVGTVIDHGPYAATMIGEYDDESKTVRWQTNAKDLAGKPMIQKTVVTQKSENERLLVLSVPGEKDEELIKLMQIRFVKRELPDESDSAKLSE